MRKIPTLFVRDPDDRKHVLNEVTPGCEWVLAGEGVATRKLDGTCVMLDERGQWWARREVKADKDTPPLFQLSEYDEATRKKVGWEPIEQSGFAKFHAEAIVGDETPGTYELVGPKINGNPEQYTVHTVIPHGVMRFDDSAVPRDFDGLKRLLSDPDSDFPARYEGVVWHHPDGRMVKIKRRDFQ